jgi:hypothetical protein
MITLAASMFDVTGIATNSVDLGETLFLVVGALVAMLGMYHVARRSRR